MSSEISFGQWLKQRRKALGLAQGEIARRVGCATITLQKIEAGERRPSRQIAERLADCLGVPPEDRHAFTLFARDAAGEKSYLQAHSASRRALQTHLRNVPFPLTRLIGREGDIRTIRKRLLAEGTRLLTLIGPPGIGKSRLAIEVASQIAEEFEDGTCFVPLAPIHDSGLVVTAIAQSLGLTEWSNLTPRERVLQYLRERQMLLVLDNFEQVVPAAPLVAELLTACPWLQVMTTSREALSVRGERRFRVPPLALPDPTLVSPSTASLAEYSAVTLFVERAQAAAPDFAINSANAPTIVAICRRLDGLPLAIELVAVRITALSPQMLLEQLSSNQVGRNLMLRSDGIRDAEVRHKTLYNAISWSFQLLTPQEQTLFARLGVFVGGWTLEAAMPICGGETLEVLTSLINKSLVMRHEHDGKARYTMLETIHEYARARLEESGEAEMLELRHADYFLGLAESADASLHGPQQLEWLSRLRAEQDNLRAALTRMLVTVGGEREAEIGVRLTTALWWFWVMDGHVTEGRTWFERMLMETQHVRPAIEMIRAKAIPRAGYLALLSGDIDQAAALAEHDVFLCRDVEEQQGLALSILIQGEVTRLHGDMQQAETLFGDSLRLFREADDPWSVALVLYELGGLLLVTDDYERAASCYEEGLQLCRTLEDRWGMARLLSGLGYAVERQDNDTRALALLEEGLALSRETGMSLNVAWNIQPLARFVHDRGDYTRARILCEEALALGRDQGIQEIIAYALRGLGEVAWRLGDSDLAIRQLEESLALFQGMKDTQNIAYVQHALGNVALFRREYERATSFFRQSLLVFRTIGDVSGAAHSLHGIAAVAMARQQSQTSACLLGAEENIRQTAGVILTPVQKLDYARDVAALRDQLDEATFAIAWSEGGAMTLDEAVKLALSIL